MANNPEILKMTTRLSDEKDAFILHTTWNIGPAFIGIDFARPDPKQPTYFEDIQHQLMNAFHQNTIVQLCGPMGRVMP